MYSIGYKDKDGFIRLLHRSNHIPVTRFERLAEANKELMLKDINDRLNAVEVITGLFGLSRKEVRKPIPIHNRLELERIVNTITVLTGNIDHLTINPVDLDELLK